MTIELRHKGLAKCHDFAVGLSLGTKIGASLCATHRQCGEAVLEDLLKAEELQHTQCHTRIEA